MGKLWLLGLLLHESIYAHRHPVLALQTWFCWLFLQHYSVSGRDSEESLYSKAFIFGTFFSQKHCCLSDYDHMHRRSLAACGSLLFLPSTHFDGDLAKAYDVVWCHVVILDFTYIFISTHILKLVVCKNAAWGKWWITSVLHLSGCVIQDTKIQSVSVVSNNTVAGVADHNYISNSVDLTSSMKRLRIFVSIFFHYKCSQMDKLSALDKNY